MKALSIRQPWADAIIYWGKDIENRSWSTSYRGPLLIHAATRWTDDERAILLELVCTGDIPDTQTPLLGGIIGAVDVVDVVTNHSSEWFTGPYGWVLSNPRPLPFRPMRGKLGLFEVEENP